MLAASFAYANDSLEDEGDWAFLGQCWLECEHAVGGCLGASAGLHSLDGAEQSQPPHTAQLHRHPLPIWEDSDRPHNPLSCIGILLGYRRAKCQSAV